MGFVKKYLIIAALAVIVFILIWLGIKSLFDTPSIFVNKDQAAVVKEMQELGRLETASFTIEKIIDAGTQGSALRQFLFGDRLLLIAHGQVIAGFDLSQISSEDVDVSGSEITIDMPAPQILFTRLDSQKTRVYDRERGLLARGENNLEATARAEAEKSIQDAACEAGILNESSQNARKQLGSLFSVLGFTSVTLNIPSGEC